MRTQLTTHTTLLARLAHGSDPTAWREFSERYDGLIRSFARRQGLQDADCDDLVQDVLIELTKSMPGFRYDPAKGKFRNYLKTIVMRAIFRRFRQNRGPRGQLSIEETPEAAALGPEIETAWEVEWREYHMRLAMRTIEVEFNPIDREAFDSYVVDGRDASDTAKVLGTTVDRVYRAKSRIMKRLAEVIEEQVRDEG